MTGFSLEANNLMTSQSIKKFSGLNIKNINGNEAGVDVIQFLISYVNFVVVMLTSIFLERFP